LMTMKHRLLAVGDSAAPRLPSHQYEHSLLEC
jgi:hypothetical protein